MANTNNLEFLGREGLTTLLSQVNTNTSNIKQADWNQNDPQASDYIKNRTHYFALKDSISESTGFVYGTGGQFTVEESNRFCAQAPDGDICFKPGVYSRTGTGFGGTESEIVSDIGVTSLFNGGIYLSYPAGGPNSCYIVIDGYISGGEDASLVTLTYTETELKQLDAKYIPIDNNTLTTDANGKLKANIPSDGLVYKETTTTETISLTMPVDYMETPVLCYGNGRLVLLGHDADTSLAYYSDDRGQTWQEGTPVAGQWPSKLVFGNGVFVGLCDGHLLCSADGITWTEDQKLLGVIYCTDIAFGDGKFVTIGYYHTADIVYRLAISTDGINWTSRVHSSFIGNRLAVGNSEIISIDETGSYWVFNLDGELINPANVFMDPSDGINFINDNFVIYGASGGIATIAISSNGLGSGLNWQTVQISTDQIGVADVLYVQGKYLAYADHNYVYESVDNGVSWSPAEMVDLPSYTYVDNTVIGCTGDSLEVSTDGINWATSITNTNSKAYLEQAGTDVTSKVAKLVGGNGGTADLENATLENLTITGALTIDGDLAFGDLDVTTVTAEKVIISNDPVDDNDVATKRYVDEHSGGGAGSGDTYTVSVKTSGATSGTYLKDSAGNEQKILNLYDITTTGSESSITNGRLTGNPGTGIKYSQVFGNGHTIGNNLSSSLIRGQNHTIGSDVNHVDVSGYKNTLANGADYNTIHGTEFNVTGTHNVTFGVGGNCTINGKANMMAGDLTGSTITGNYNTILCGGGQNTITGTASDPCQHNVILGSTTTLTSAENCLTLGRLNTINNHDRAVLMGIGLTATRDNQFIVGSYNDETKTGGAFVVGNGSAGNHSNAMIVYNEGTVTIGHDPIGPMDVATKQYVDSHSGGSGGVDEEQVRAIVEDVLLNGNW